MKSNRTFNTLFMLMSVDGKICTGVGDRDIDLDSKNIKSLREGRSQYDQLELETDLASFNTGKVMEKMGWNESKTSIKKIPVDFIIVDNKPHLTERGLRNLCKRVKKLYIVTSNSNHPAIKMQIENLEVIYYDDKVDFTDLFIRLKTVGIERVTIQSGGTMNTELVRACLIEELSLVVAPILVGGSKTSSLLDGVDIVSTDDLSSIADLDLINVTEMSGSYIHYRYSVRKK